MALLSVIAALGDLLSQIPDHWDPHQRLESMKMAMRTTIAEATCRERGEVKIKSNAAAV